MDAKQILESIENSEYNYFGLRSMTPNPHGKTEFATVGKILHKSHVWVDGNSTSKKLCGTSALMLVPDDPKQIEKMIKQVAMYDGNQVVLLGADYREDGNDPFEIIMSDAVVLSVWSK